MAEDAVDRLFSELSPTDDQFSRSKIYSLLRTRVAGGLEAAHLGDESNPFWKGVNDDLGTIEKDPQQAFQFAVESLSLTEPTHDPDQFRAWIKGNALIILATPAVHPLLVDDFNKGETSMLHGPLESILKFEIPESVKTNDDLSEYPQCFNLVMGMRVVRSLPPDMPSVADLRDRTEDLLGNNRVRDIINLYYAVPVDREIVEPLYQAIQTAS